MELQRYDLKGKKWSQYMNYENEIEKKYGKDYDSDCESDEKNDENIELNTINFSLDNEKILSEIEKILNINIFNKYTSLELLKSEDLLASYLSKSIVQNNNRSFQFLIRNLNWLKECSNVLAKRLKLEPMQHNEHFIRKNKIIRSSYKFCTFKNACNYNYTKGHKGCYADHYVHNMIHADIDALIKCLNKYYKEEIISNKEVIKCINTISFVIKHMYEELNNLCIYADKSEHEHFHVLNNHSVKNFNVKKRNSS
jgi:hypothetical protein